MKRKLYLFAFLFIVLGAVSCEDDKTEFVEPAMSFGPTSLTVGSNAAIRELQVQSSVPWNVTSTPAWCIVSPMEGGAGATVLTLAIDQNETFEEQNSSIVFSSEGQNFTFYITQAMNEEISTEENLYLVYPDQTELIVPLRYSVDWTLKIPSEQQSWLTWEEPVRALGTEDLKFIVGLNETGDQREAVVRVSKNEGGQTSLFNEFTVRQEGMNFVLNPTNGEHEYTSSTGGFTVQSNMLWEVDIVSSTGETPVIGNEVAGPWYNITFRNMGRRGTGNVLYSLQRYDNYVKDRTLTLTFTYNNGTTSQFVITQKKRVWDGNAFDVTDNRLSEQIAAENYSTTTKVKLDGTMTAEDFIFIRDNLTNIEVLDFSLATLEGGVIPAEALYKSTSLGTLTTFAFPQGVTEIGDKAFANLSSLEGPLTIPEGVTKIGEYAFNNIGSDGELNLPASLTTLGEGAFMDAANLLGTVDLSNVTEIPDMAFSGCEALNRKLILSGNLTSIGVSAFEGCGGLRDTLTIPAGVTEILENTFKGCETFSWLELPANLDVLGASAFEGCAGFKSPLVIPAGITTLESRTFYGCESFKSLDLNEVTSIADEVFTNCGGFTGALDLEGVTSIGESAFMNCTGFNETLTIPSTITAIADYTFMNSGFKEIDLGSSVETIGVAAFADMQENYDATLVIPSSVMEIGERAFSGAINILDGHIDFSGATSLTTIGKEAFMNSHYFGNLAIPNSVTRIEESAFMGGNYDGTLVLPTNLEYIGANAFNGNSGFTGDLTIPNTVTEIGESAFYGNSGFDGVFTLSSNATTIGVSAFDGCSNLTGDLTLPDGLDLVNVRAFAGMAKLAGTLTIPSSVTTINESAFNGCSSLTGDLTLPDGLDLVSVRAFAGMAKMAGALTIPSSVTTINESAFDGCVLLTLSGDLDLSNVTFVGKRAFYGAAALAGELRLSSSLTTVGEAAFQGCKLLTSTALDLSSVYVLGTNAFNGCELLAGTLTLSSDPQFTTIGASTFNGCKGLTGALVIPEYVAKVDANAFNGCESFTSIGFNAALVGIGNTAFQGMTGVTSATSEIKWPTRMELGTTVFNGITVGTPLTVPAGYLEEYERDSQWKTTFTAQAAP